MSGTGGMSRVFELYASAKDLEGHPIPKQLVAKYDDDTLELELGPDEHVANVVEMARARIRQMLKVGGSADQIMIMLLLLDDVRKARNASKPINVIHVPLDDAAYEKPPLDGKPVLVEFFSGFTRLGWHEVWWNVASGRFEGAHGARVFPLMSARRWLSLPKEYEPWPMSSTPN